MSKYAVMPLSDYDEACDKIRELSVTEEIITSEILPSKITSVYDKGFENGKYTLYGTYIFKEVLSSEELTKIQEIISGEDGATAIRIPVTKVYSYFRSSDTDYLLCEVATIQINSIDNIAIEINARRAFSYEINGYITVSTQYDISKNEWISNVLIEIGGVPYNSTYQGDTKVRVITFTEPNNVLKLFHEAFISIVDIQSNIYDEGENVGIDKGKEQVYTEIEPINTELAQTIYGNDGVTEGTVIEALDSNVKQAKADFEAIENKIVANGVEVAEGTPTAEYAPKIDEVYEQGKKAQYDEFWDGVFSTVSWQGKFYGSSWNDKTFYPDRDLKPTNSANSLFSLCLITDIPSRLQECEVVLDTTNVTGRIDNMFAYALALTRAPYVDTTNASDTYGVNTMYSNCTKLHTIDGLKLKDNGLQKLNDAFYACYELVNLIIEGVIGQNVNLQWSKKLTKASWISVVTHTSTTASITITGSLVSVNKAFETSEGANDGSTSAEWLNLIATRPNVTFNLV